MNLSAASTEAAKAFVKRWCFTSPADDFEAALAKRQELRWRVEELSAMIADVAIRWRGRGAHAECVGIAVDSAVKNGEKLPESVLLAYGRFPAVNLRPPSVAEDAVALDRAARVEVDDGDGPE